MFRLDEDTFEGDVEDVEGVDVDIAVVVVVVVVVSVDIDWTTLCVSRSLLQVRTCLSSNC
jgi:hypothetical protein